MNTTQTLTAGATKQVYKRWSLRPRWQAWLLTSPLVLALLVIGVYPAVYTIAASVARSTLGRPFQKFVGMSNFSFALSGDFADALMRTVFFALPTSALQMVLGVAIAMLLIRVNRFSGVWRALIFLPMMTPPVMIGMAWKLMLLPSGGLLNAMLVKVGMLSAEQSFLGQMPWAVFAVALADTWQWTPFVVLLSYAAIRGLPDDIRQAAYMDGAGPVRTFFSVQFPLLVPALLGIFLIKLIISFKIFDLVYVLTAGGPGTGTTLAGYAIFRTLLQSYDVGLAAAQVLLLVVVVTIITLPIMRLHRKYAEASQA